MTIDDPRAGRLQAYAARSADSPLPPLLLVHSINAAGSAYEVKPLFEHYERSRPTYALDLPGFGRSDASDRRYSPRMMTDAIHAMVAAIRKEHGPGPIDALAVSLASEFLARAATEDSTAFRSLALVSPTGLGGRKKRHGPKGSTRELPGLHGVLAFDLWGRGLYRNLTRPSVIRYFLEKTWGGKAIDEGLLAYDVVLTRQPGAEHAPLYFLSGALFSNDVNTLYDSLELPVWIGHGVRGDFADYDLVDQLKTKPNVDVAVFQTGALPHFEVLEAFTASVDAFLAKVG